MGRRLRDGEMVIVSSHALLRLAERKHLYMTSDRKVSILELVQRAWDAAADAARLGAGFLIIKETGLNEVTVVTFTPSLRLGEVAA